MSKEEAKELVETLISEHDLEIGERKPSPRTQNRPSVLEGQTEKIQTGYGTLYATINRDPATDQPFEMFATIGKSGGYTESWNEALARMVSLALRTGVDPHRVIDQLDGIRAPEIAFDRGGQVQSVPDAFAKALARSIEEPEPVTVEGLPDQDPLADGSGTDAKVIVAAGKSPECPDCGAPKTLQEGCEKCEACGWSRC